MGCHPFWGDGHGPFFGDGHGPLTLPSSGHGPEAKENLPPQAKRSLNWYTHQGATALMIAVTQGNVMATKALLDGGAGATSTLARVAVVHSRGSCCEGAGRAGGGEMRWGCGAVGPRDLSGAV